MKEDSYWKKFCSTGKVEDYLKCCSNQTEYEEKNIGDRLNAGTSNNNRDDIKDNAYRGIR